MIDVNKLKKVKTNGEFMSFIAGLVNSGEIKPFSTYREWSKKSFSGVESDTKKILPEKEATASFEVPKFTTFQDELSTIVVFEDEDYHLEVEYFHASALVIEGKLVSKIDITVPAVNSYKNYSGTHTITLSSREGGGRSESLTALPKHWKEAIEKNERVAEFIADYWDNYDNGYYVTHDGKYSEGVTLVLLNEASSKES